MHRTTFALAILTGLAGPVQAQEEQADDRPWRNRADLSVVITGGNSSTTSLSFSDEFTYAWSTSEVRFRASALRTRTETRILTNVDGTVRADREESTTAESYALNGRYRYTFQEGVLFSTGAGWERNRLAGIDDRFVVRGGVGYRILRSETDALVAEVGADWTSEARIAGPTETYFGTRALLSYERTLSATSRFESDVEVLENLEDTEDLRVNWISSVSASLTSVLALQLGYELAYDRQPVVVLVEGAPFEFDETDTKLTTSVVLNF